MIGHRRAHLFAIAGGIDDIAMAGQERDDQLADAGIVIDDEKAGLQIHSARGQSIL